jgi:hypothetical protein
MKNLILVSILVLSVSAVAQTVPSVICDRNLKATSPLFQNALTNVYSFSYIHHALEQVQTAAGPEGAVFCTSSVVLSKNIYQYFQHLIQIDVYPKGAPQPTYRFRLLFQNASVQAFHNVGGQPWVGLDTALVDQTVAAMVTPAQYHPFTAAPGEQDPVKIARQSASFLKDGANINPDSVGAIPLAGDKKLYLVTWLTRSSDDPFAGFVMTRGVLVSFAADQSIQLAENIFPGDLLITLENQRDDLESKVGPSSQWMDRLLAFAAKK